MSNNITIELCAEDRARIDKLTDALERKIRQAQYILEHTEAPKPKPEPQDDLQEKLAAAVASVKTSDVEAPKNAQDAQEAPTPTENPTEPINGAQEEPAEHWDPLASFAQHCEKTKPKEPTVTMQMLTNKAITLSAAGLKDKVRDVVHQYAKTVTSLPEDKWDEVYEKLNALEG